MKNELPDIFQYIDYRKYLDDYYGQKKLLDPSFTHTYICNRLGQGNAKSYFNNGVKGRANVSSTFVDRFISLLELKSDEAKYFRALVNYNQTTSPHEKEFFFDQLVRLNSTPHRVIDKNAYEFYKEWYHSAIRALLDIIDIKDDYKALAAKIFPAITLKQARFYCFVTSARPHQQKQKRLLEANRKSNRDRRIHQRRHGQAVSDEMP